MNEATSAESILSKKGLPHARWQVTDLVTLGSPLAYAQLLLADGPKDFDDKVSSRELPTCPPDRSTTVNRGYYTVPLSAEAQPIGDDYDIVHHAAPFAITRWTNVHLKNDPVGNCLNEVLGKGIKDTQVCDPDGPSMFEAHNLYWPPGACDSGWKQEVRHEMLAILKGPEGPVSNAVAKVLRCEARRAASGSHIRLERRRLLAALHNSHAPQADWLHVRSYITRSRGATLRTACIWSMMLVLRQAP